MNKVFLIGNLTRDPELSETSNGTEVCHFSIAVQRRTEEKDADFFDCTAWRALAENIARYCKKGNKVAVTGSIQIRNYEDRNGNKRTAVDVIVQDVEFLTPKEKEAAPRSQKPTLESFDDDGDIPF